MGTVERRARHKENLRQAILEAARELFVSDGYDNVSVRKIAERIEYSPTAIYLHFKDKEEILVELSEEGFRLLHESLGNAYLSDPVERLRHGAARYFAFALHHPHYYQIMFEIAANPMVKYHQAVEETCGHKAYSFIREAVVQGQAQGVFKPEADPDVLSHAFWAAIHGAASLTHSGRLGGVIHKKLDGDGAKFREAVYVTTAEVALQGMMIPR